MKDGGDLFGDRHLDSIASGEADRRGGGADAFSDFPVESGKNIGELASLAEFDAYGAIAGEGAGAGEDEVSKTGESGKGLAAASAGDGEAGDLGHAAGDKGRSGVVAKAETVNDSRRKSNHILEGSAELDAR